MLKMHSGTYTDLEAHGAWGSEGGAEWAPPEASAAPECTGLEHRNDDVESLDEQGPVSPSTSSAAPPDAARRAYCAVDSGAPIDAVAADASAAACSDDGESSADAADPVSGTALDSPREGTAAGNSNAADSCSDHSGQTGEQHAQEEAVASPVPPLLPAEQHEQLNLSEQQDMEQQPQLSPPTKKLCRGREEADSSPADEQSQERSDGTGEAAPCAQSDSPTPSSPSQRPPLGSPTPARSPAADAAPPQQQQKPNGRRDERLAQSSTQRALLSGPASDAAALRAAIGDLRSKAAGLELRLERALRARDAAEAQLAAAEEQRRGEAAFWEARLADRAREAELLQRKLNALLEGGEGDRGAVNGGKKDEGSGGGGDAAPGSLSAEDAALMAAYQAENEAAMRRIKELEQQLAQARAAAAAEAGRMERDFAAAQEAERQRNADAAERLRRLLAAQSELESVRDAAAAREGELRDQLARLRREKMELERRLGGVDAEAIKADEQLVAAVRAEMAAAARDHEARVAALEERLAWYAENQVLLTEGDSLVAEQAETIRHLEARLVALEAPSGVSQRQRVRELEAEVEALQRTLASRHPNSLPAVLAAARPPPSEARLERELQSEVASLQARLAAARREHEHALRALQQQYEQLKLTLAPSKGRGRGASSGGAVGSSSGGVAVGGRVRVQELERRLQEVHDEYRRRVKTLEARAAAAEAAAAAATEAAAPAPADESTRSAIEAAVGDIDDGSCGGGAVAAELRRQLDEKRREEEGLQRRLAAAEAEVQQLRAEEAQRRAAARSGSDLDQAVQLGQATVLSQRQQQPLSKQQRRRGQQDAGAAHQRVHQIDQKEQQQQQQQQQQAAGEETEALRVELAAAQGALSALQRSHAELLQRVTDTGEGSLGSRVPCGQGNAEVWAALELREAAAAREANRWMARVDRLEQALHAAESEVARLEAALASSAAAAGPGARAFFALERRVAAMSEAAAASEARWRALLAEGAAAAASEAAAARRAHEAELAKRDVAVEGLRGQVEALIADARALQLARAR